MNQTLITQGTTVEELLANVREIVRSEIAAIPRQEKVKTYMNIDELSEFIHEAKQTIYTRTCQRTIPFLKRNGKLLFNRQEIIRWLEESAQSVEK